MITRAIRGGRFAAAAVTVAALAATGAADAGATVVARAQPSGSARYWTPERISRARSLEVVRRRSGATLKRSAPPPAFESVQVPDPTVAPLPAHGKLFGVLKGFGPFECSATVVDSPARKVLMTAGHCVYEPRLGIAATQLTFVPAYADGSRPFGRWTVSAARTPRDWIKFGNYDYDYATLTVKRRNGALVEDVVGGRPLATETPRQQTYTSYGYPVNFADAQLLWSCHGSYAGDDPHPIPGGPAPIGMGCDMKAGASGGGWVDDLGRLVSVTSFGYPRRRGFLYGPYLTAKAARLVARSG